MRVLMTADCVGGVWGYSIELARALAAHDVEFLFAVMGGEPSQAQRDEAALVPNLTLANREFKLEWMTEPWDGVAHAGDWLLDLEKEFAPDLVHVNGYAHAALPWRVPALVVAHFDIYSWWLAVHGERPPDEWLRYYETVQRGLRAASRIVAPTYAMLTELKNLYDFTAPAAVIPNARDENHYRTGPKEPIVLTAGRMPDRAKNVEALRGIAADVSIPIFCAGNGGDAESQPNFTSLGVLPSAELAAWYARAAIYALPARYEPFGLSVLEAALSACALVLGDIDSLRENWDGAAIFVSPDNPEALQEVINDLAGNPEQCEALGTLAHRRAMKFNPERMAEGYLRTYRLLTSGSRRVAFDDWRRPEARA